MTFIGIDLGTSGVRACAIDENGAVLAMCTEALPSPLVDGNAISQDASIWWRAVEAVLYALAGQIDTRAVQAIAVDGTSGTLLVSDDQGTPLAPALMYNDSQCQSQAALIKSIAPEDCAAHGASAGLAKLLLLAQQHPQAKHALHQADWVAGKLCGRFGISDENNALKTGYDAINRCWPEWMQQLPLNRELLPEVLAPGSVISPVSTEIAQQFGFDAQAKIVSGTTDSIAAFIATGVSKPGEAVTSLGSTLVVKIISEQPVYSPQHGIYSHRLGSYWLAGGASNSGGAVLHQFFSDQQIQQLTAQINPQQPSGLDYYPLPKVGERFPVNDAKLPPRLQPRPQNDGVFFQGILEGIARIEQQAYRKLHELGAPYPVSVQTAGGGSNNPGWTQIRQQLLGVPVKRAAFTEACYGSALLARRGTVGV